MLEATPAQSRLLESSPDDKALPLLGKALDMATANRPRNSTSRQDKGDSTPHAPD
jgi:hypothetical protein